MAQLFFRYGAMNASKSMQLLTVAHNYEEQGKKALIFCPEIDNRYGTGKVTSRIGISKPAINLNDDIDIIALYVNIKPDCILIDEAHFLTEGQIITFAQIVDKYDIPVICYGLLRDFKAELFEGSKALIKWADKIEEIKTICTFCRKKATHILRVKDGKVVYSGDQIQIGGNESYISVCRKHWFSPERIK